MAYQELMKDFQKIRDYIRDFYLYGFKTREDFDQKSLRSYDDKRRQIENWLGDFVKARQGRNGKSLFLAIDSRSLQHNPLYQVWRSKSFTDGDIVLHFYLLDILTESLHGLSLQEIMQEIDLRMSGFEQTRIFDPSTVRKKLKEYLEIGLVLSEKRGKTLYFRRPEEITEFRDETLHFFSEVSPLGVVGYYLLNRQKREPSPFWFKHHYITEALDSEILLSVFDAISEKKKVMIESKNKDKNLIIQNVIIPLKVFLSVQNGRQYVMAYSESFHRIQAFRMDNIITIKTMEKADDFEKYHKKLEKMQKHVWGVSTQSFFGKGMEEIRFTLTYEEGEEYIVQRVIREKRCGKVEVRDAEISFTVRVYDASELIPWIRSFISRIKDLHFSTPKLRAQFLEDLEEMYRIYGLERDENDI